VEEGGIEQLEDMNAREGECLKLIKDPVFKGESDAK
jgi:hypothetical protein